MASKNFNGKAFHAWKDQVDLLQNDTTYPDRVRDGVQKALRDLYGGLNGDALAGKTVTVTSDYFASATSPSVTVSVAFS